MPAPGPLQRVDVALDRTLRRIARTLAAPATALTRWEVRSRRAVIRTLVARPSLVAVAAGLVLVLAAGVHLDRFAVTPDSSPVTTGAPERIGPVTGTDIGRYVDRRHELLLALDGEDAAGQLRAVVSFAEFATLGTLPLPDDVQVERVQVLLPSELEPRELAADGARAELEAVLAGGRDEVDEEIAELEQHLTEDIGDPAFAAEFAEQLERLVTLREGDADSVPVVFAAVVVAPGTRLQELIGAPGIRLVDPAGSEELTREIVLVGVPAS